MARVSIFLVTVVLIAGVVGCGQPTPFHHLTIAGAAGGSVTSPGEGTFIYVMGEMVNLVAEAQEGYQFLKWTGDVGTIANVETATTTITMSGDCSIAANFQAIPARCNLTIPSTDGGSVTTPGEGTFMYTIGTVVSLNATPDAGYRFVNWTGNVDTIDNVEAASTNITMNADYSITANFVAVYNLTIISAAGGSVTVPGEGIFPYDAGTVVNLIATPGAGHHFVNWTGDVDTIGNVSAASTTITVNASYSITANFEVIPPVRYRLTISSTAGGSVTVPGEGTFTYDAGAVVNLVANPTRRYRFVNWTGDVGTIANVTAASTMITMNGHYSITANFNKKRL